MQKMSFTSTILTVALACMLVELLTAPVLAGQRDGAPDADEVNNGQDPTRPPTRFDLRYNYQELTEDRQQHIFTLRADKPFVVRGGWQLATCFDLPFVYNHIPSGENPTRAWTLGTGDLLLQGLVIKAFNPWHAAAFGTQVVFPTASRDQFGTGRYQLVPTVAYRYSLHEFSPGSFAAGLIRYAFDNAGAEHQPATMVVCDALSEPGYPHQFAG